MQGLAVPLGFVWAVGYNTLHPFHEVTQSIVVGNGAFEL